MPTFTTGGVSIRLDATEPDGPGPFPAILLLHGAGGNAGFWLDRIAPFVGRLGIAVYAVHYFDRTDTTRADMAILTDGVHVPLWLTTVADAIRHIAANPKIEPRRIALVGVSLGAYLSLALATEPGHPLIRAIVELSGGLPDPYSTRATATFPPTLILHGDQDNVVPVTEAHALEQLLTRLGVQHKIEILRGEGHWFSSAAQLRILTAVAAFLGRYLAR